MNITKNKITLTAEEISACEKIVGLIDNLYDEFPMAFEDEVDSFGFIEMVGRGTYKEYKIHNITIEKEVADNEL